MPVYALVLTVSALTYIFTVILLCRLTRRRQSVARRIELISRENKKGHVVGAHLRRDKVKTILKFLDLKFLDTLANELYMAAIPLRVEEYMAIWLLLAIGIPALSVFLGAKLMVTLGLFIIGFPLPVVIIKFKKGKRMSLFNKQLVDALVIMCNCLKTGFTFQTAMESVAREMPDPIAGEFGRVLREIKLGLSLESSLGQMVKRTGNKDLDLISNAVLIQRQVGGNLSEILESISRTINERIKIRDEIKVLTATGRISGYVVGLMPIFILVILSLISPDYVEKFFVTQEGRLMLGISAVLESVGFLIVKKIVAVKF